MMDFVERVRIIEQDHEPDGWPAIQTHELRAAANEIQRLREELAKREWQTIETAPHGLPMTDSAGQYIESEWFIALDKHGERQMIRRLHSQHSYTFEDWAGTHYQSDWFVLWMPLPAPPKEDA